MGILNEFTLNFKIAELDTSYSGKLESTDIQNLLKNLVKVLKHCTVDELNEHLFSAMDRKGDKYYAEKYIISLVCETYNISHRNLIYSKSNPNISKPRQVAFCLLHFTLGLSTRYIANRIFHLKYHNVVGLAIKSYKTLDPSIKPDKEMLDSIEMLRLKVVEKLQTNENEK